MPRFFALSLNQIICRLKNCEFLNSGGVAELNWPSPVMNLIPATGD